jgi:hypothetical protein
MPRDEAQGEEVAEGNWKGERSVLERGGLRKKAVVAAAVVVVVVGGGDKVKRGEEGGEEERRGGGVELEVGSPASQSLSRGATSALSSLLVLSLAGGRGSGGLPWLWFCGGVFASSSANKKVCQSVASEAIALGGVAGGAEGAVKVWE